MKKSSFSAIAILSCFYFQAQVDFWTENFGTGCNQAQLVTSYSSANGNWTVTNTGTNASQANAWYVSAMENGNVEGECGTGCGNDRTLHIGNVFIDAGFTTIPADGGASYYEGLSGFCGAFPCGATSKRVESPVISCSGYSDITLSFLYIEGGNAQDNATLWYYDGTTWSQLADPAKTFSESCSPQGIWTNYSISLPVSANDNPNVKIGFRWINNEDGTALDPSFALDDIVISGMQSDDQPPVINCPWSQIQIDAVVDCVAAVPDMSIYVSATDDLDTDVEITQSIPIGTMTLGAVFCTVTATDDAGNTDSCVITLLPVDNSPPVISCVSEITVEPVEGEDLIFVEIPVPDVFDNCVLGAVYNSYNLSLDASDYYPVGTTMVTWTASDDWGNTAWCTSAVIVDEICCAADYNCDGVINVSDLLVFMGEFGVQSALADLTGDGVANIQDLLIFMGEFGTFCP